MSDVTGLLHDPTTGTSPRVQVSVVGGSLRLRGAAVERDVSVDALTVAGGGWDGRQIHLTWSEDGKPFSLTVEAGAAAQLAPAFPPPLARTLEELLATARRGERRGRRTVPLLVFFFVVLPLAALGGLYLMRDRLIDAALSRLPPAVDVQVGDLVHRQISAEGRLLKEGPAVEAVRAVGGRLAAASGAPFAFRFEVVRDPSVNAFAAPGGVVVVHTGLITAAQTPDELSGVLAHEVAHVVDRHSMRQMIFRAGLGSAVRLLLGSPESAAGMIAGAVDLTALKFSREQEEDADRRGLDLLRDARLPATGFVRFFDTLKAQGASPPALLSSHPPSNDRIARLSEELRRRGDWPVQPLTVDWEAVRAAAR